MIIEFNTNTVDKFLSITAQDFKMLISLCRISNHSDIYFSTQIRLAIMNDLAIKNTHFSNCINRLKVLGFIAGTRNDYKLINVKVSEVDVASIKFIINISNP